MSVHCTCTSVALVCTGILHPEVSVVKNCSYNQSTSCVTCICEFETNIRIPLCNF